MIEAGWTDLDDQEQDELDELAEVALEQLMEAHAFEQGWDDE